MTASNQASYLTVTHATGLPFNGKGEGSSKAPASAQASTFDA
jgi:hypothetical protein